MQTIARLIAAGLVAIPLSDAVAQVSAPWFPFDTCMFLGNTIRGRQPGHLIAALDLRHNGRFWIQMAESDDDGHSWRIAAPAAHDDAHDFWDPSLARLPDGSLVLEFHGGGAMTIMRSTDEGAHWKQTTVFPGRNSEGYWQPLPDGRLALLYAQTAWTQTTTYWVRTTRDGSHFTDPKAVGDGGAIWDGTRAGLGPVREDSGGILRAVYPHRDKPTDSVTVFEVSLDSHTLDRRGPPRALGVAIPPFRGIGVFPVLIACADGDHVLYSDWSEQGGGRTAIWEIAPGRPPAPVVERPPMQTGFGRVWLIPTWNGAPQVAWHELPNGPHTTVVGVSRPDFEHCAY